MTKPSCSKEISNKQSSCEQMSKKKQSSYEQVSKKKQLSCEQVQNKKQPSGEQDLLVAEESLCDLSYNERFSSQNRSLYDKSQTQEVELLELVELNNINKSVACELEENNVQGKL